MIISGEGTFTFNTKDEIIDYICLLGNNRLAYPVASVENKTYFFYNHFIFTKD